MPRFSFLFYYMHHPTQSDLYFHKVYFCLKKSNHKLSLQGDCGRPSKSGQPIQPGSHHPSEPVHGRAYYEEV